MTARRRGSIKRELTSIIMLTSLAGLVLAFAAFLLNDIRTLRQSMKRNIDVLGQVISDNSTAALVFTDSGAAEEVLSALRAEIHIVRAVILDAAGAEFADFLRDPGVEMPPFEEPSSTGSFFEAGRLVHFQEIDFDGERVGNLLIESDLEEINDRYRQYAVAGGAFLFVGVLVTFLVATALQRRISKPILDLTAVARKVSEEEEYSVRVPLSGSNNELAILIEGFNDMLSQIQARDSELERHRGRLEEQVAARTSELQAVNQQLEKATQHKSEFLASMSHELRTPLNAVIGFSEVLSEKMFGDLNEKQDEYVGDILTSGRHLLSLINDILDLSKVEAGRMELNLEDFDLPSAIEDAVLLVREKAVKHGQRLTVEIDPDLDQMRADERKLKQILLNLLSNAVKFTPEGGAIDLGAARDGENVRITVSDTGIGIPAEDHDTIFEEFRQVRNDETQAAGGTGLGLTLTKKFVELHGGEIWLESQVGEGTTIGFTLPLRGTT